MSAPTITLTSATPIRTIFWSRSAAPMDIEAQIVTGSHSLIHLPLPLPQAATHTTRSVPSAERTTNPLDDFFGITRSSSPRPSMSSVGTRESRHDTIASLNGADSDLPPPYNASAPATESLPSYAHSQEVQGEACLAMYLFKYGFLFPPFWLVGALIMFLSLSAPADWQPHKSETERQEMLKSMRKTEVKWAKRCAFAVTLFLLVIAAAVGVGFGVMRG